MQKQYTDLRNYFAGTQYQSTTLLLHPQPLDIAPPGIGRNFQKDLSCKVSAVKLV